MRLYAITAASLSSASPQAAEDALVALVRQWAAGGVEFIQIRERQIGSGALERLARRVVSATREARVELAPDIPARVLDHSPALNYPKVLINGRADVAIAAGADGVHLAGQGALTPAEVRRLYAETALKPPIVSVACHSVDDVERARDSGATLAVFAPVFGKLLRAMDGNPAGALAGVGLAALQAGCQAAGSMPVFALGGVLLDNAASCISAGAAGVAAVRLFQSAEWLSLQAPDFTSAV